MIFEFGPFRYDSEQRLLFRGDERVPLVPKAAETLQVLLEHRGKVVEKAELMKLVWPATTVEDVGLARNISLLRRTLGDDSDENPYIETIPRRGYRFVAATSPGPEPVLVKRRWKWWWLAVPVLAGLVYFQFYVPSTFLGGGGVAVVPFACACSEDISAVFSDSLSDELSKINGLAVVAPSTVRRHQRVGVSMGLMGRLLGLDALVEGTIQTTAETVQVNVRLVDVHTGRILWADRFSGKDAYREIAAEVGRRMAKR